MHCAVVLLSHVYAEISQPYHGLQNGWLIGRPPFEGSLCVGWGAIRRLLRTPGTHPKVIVCRSNTLVEESGVLNQCSVHGSHPLSQVVQVRDVRVYKSAKGEGHHSLGIKSLCSEWRRWVK